MNDLVSILIPAYNSEKWIGETIKSAINQTWSNKEIIIVDDGSTDNTLRIVREFESRLVKIITQENSGASAARNTALAHAQGDYIQWLDSDDILAPDKLSQQFKYVDMWNNEKVLFSSAVGHFYFRHHKAKFIPNLLWQDLEPLDWIITRFTGNLNVWMQPGAWLISRKLIDMSGPWDERLSLDDDGEYSCRLVTSSESVKFVPEATLFYRTGNFGSLARNLSDKALESYFLSMRLCMDHLLTLANNETTRSACLNFLQRRVFLFYPGKHEILEKVNELARDLGGTLCQPDERWGWKFALAKKILGWKNAMFLKSITWKAEISARKNWDRLFYLLYNK